MWTIQHERQHQFTPKETPINSLADLKGLKMRLPGGMGGEVFARFGVAAVSLPGSDSSPALEKGTIDVLADMLGQRKLGIGFSSGHQ